jgi:hypothetical protein
MESVTPSDVAIQQLEDGRVAFAVDGIVRYVGNQEECERRATIRLRKNDRASQDQALLRWASLSR